jgi:Asp-tRNA(Asn)/Glu-tRNA(Gln) amidotransferase A subunit family amidase
VITDTIFAPAARLAREGRDGQRTAVDVLETYLDRIDAHNDDVIALVTVTAQSARERARDLQARLDAGTDIGSLAGLPVGIKDISDVAGVPTTHGAIPFEDHVPDESAGLVERLEAAGAIVVGQRNTPEFGFKAATDNELFDPPATPFDTHHVSGGSSGGSAAAVAHGLVALAQGSDDGGSIRIPGACRGCDGYEPSFGHVPDDSRPDGFGHHIPFVFTGPLTRTVEDAALSMDVMAGPDHDLDVDELGENFETMYLTGFAAIADRVAEERGFEYLGAHPRWASPGLPGMMERGRDLDAVTFARADEVRPDWYDAVQALLTDHDLLVTPTLAVASPEICDEQVPEVDGQKIDPYTGWLLTWPFNRFDNPGASITAGLVEGLPVGMQIAGPQHADDDVIAASAAFERQRPWHDEYPG